MTTDSRKYLVITYNALNLQQSLSQNGTIVASYTWLADGTKCGVVDNNNNGYDYTGSLIYNRSGSVRTPESIENGAGRIIYSGGTYNPHYYITDHLGSTRVITDNNGSVVERDDYYPFGGQLAISTYPQLSVNRFKFNGKELQTTGNTGFLDYGARMYDDVIGRWGVVDPKAADAPGWSPYKAFFNNPLRFIDPYGLFEIETGKIEKGDNLTTIAKQLNDKFKTNLTVEQIAKANNINDVDNIKTGNFIKLPGTDVELKFDLKSLKVTDVNYSVDIPGLEWKGTSGREGYQSSEFQEVQDKGPIPEGEYKVDPAHTQSISDIGSWDRFKGNFGGGTWPGLEKSWGEHRTWLTPSNGTNTHGRGGFTIHGGSVPGSAGCIDLTSRNNSFHNWLGNYGKPLILIVKY